MKKLAIVFLCLSLIISLCACGGNKANDDANFGDNDVVAPDSWFGDTLTGHYEVGDGASQNATDGVGSATSQGGEVSTTDNIIKKEKALEIALAHAGLNESDVFDLEIELDYEPTGTFWEVGFKIGGYEYDYEINAVTEAIVKSEKEKD